MKQTNKKTNRQRDIKLYAVRHGLYICKRHRTKALETLHNTAVFRSHVEGETE